MISVRSRTRALTSSSRLRCWRGLRSSLQITTSNSPSSFMSRSEATLPMPRKCAGSTSYRRCTSVPTTSVPAVRARSASSAVWPRRPYIKGRAWRLDLPAEAVQGVGHNAMAARVDSARCPRLLLPTVHRLDRRPLDRLENARVDVRLQLADQVHEVRAAADP